MLFTPPLKHLPPEAYREWLTYRDCLTDKLKAIAGDASLSVLHQVWEPANDWDKAYLGLMDQQVIHREILVSAYEKPCWYARTIIPSATYEAHASQFMKLQSVSLGDIIFNTPSIQRIAMANYVIDTRSIEYHWLSQDMHQDTHPLWVRLSEFTMDTTQTTSFFLLEILLPGLSSYFGEHTE